ncbi:MAG: DMT family transporter [Oscillospiraceae bacterium]
MGYLSAVLSAVLISVTLVINGELSAVHGVWLSTVLIHVTGFCLISAVVALRRARLFTRLPWTAYLGGAIGVATVVFNNFAYGRISVSSILALGLLGQTLTALGIDRLGLFGMPVKKMTAGAVLGLVFTCGGIWVLLSGDAFVLLPVLLSLLTGATIVLGRSFNARLGQQAGIVVSTWWNYAVGLVLSLLLLAINHFAGGGAVPSGGDAPLWIYTGGLIGVLFVALSSFAAPKMPVFRMTLILFVGQVFTGIVLDALLSGSFSLRNLAGGGLVLVGLSANLLLDRPGTPQAPGE